MTLASFIGQALIGWLAADFLGAVFHWWEDRVGREDMWLIGPQIVVPNRVHHHDPLRFTRSTLLARNAPLWIVAAVVGAVWWLTLGPSVVLAFALLGGALTNEVHVLAHDPKRCGPVLRTLQEVGIIQSPRHHLGHHRTPSDQRYCILTDWLNPVLDGVGFWGRLEGVLASFGLEPNRGTA